MVDRTESCVECKHYQKKHNEEPCKSCFPVQRGKQLCYVNFEAEED
jgi:hypothetical protein